MPSCHDATQSGVALLAEAADMAKLDDCCHCQASCSSGMDGKRFAPVLDALSIAEVWLDIVGRFLVSIDSNWNGAGCTRDVALWEMPFGSSLCWEGSTKRDSHARTSLTRGYGDVVLMTSKARRISCDSSYQTLRIAVRSRP